jgi:hypothetical protein
MTRRQIDCGNKGAFLDTLLVRFRVYLCCYSRSTGDSMAGLILTSCLAHIELKQANNKSARD